MPAFLRRIGSSKSQSRESRLSRDVSTSTEYTIPYALSLPSTTTVGTRSTLSHTASSSSNYAEMMDEDNMAWGYKPKKHSRR